MQNGAYSIRVSLTQSIPPDRAADVYVLENTQGARATVTMPWSFAPRFASTPSTGRWRDNVFVDRLCKSIKYEQVDLHAYDSVSSALPNRLFLGLLFSCTIMSALLFGPGIARTKFCAELDHGRAQTDKHPAGYCYGADHPPTRRKTNRKAASIDHTTATGLDVAAIAVGWISTTRFA